MTVQELINELQKTDPQKEVAIYGENDGNQIGPDGAAISKDGVGQIIEYDDCVGIGRII